METQFSKLIHPLPLQHDPERLKRIVEQVRNGDRSQLVKDELKHINAFARANSEWFGYLGYAFRLEGDRVHWTGFLGHPDFCPDCYEGSGVLKDKTCPCCLGSGRWGYTVFITDVDLNVLEDFSAEWS